MQIVVNADKLRSTANKLEGIISDLSQKRNNLINLQSNLDYSIRYARNINQTIVNLSSRLSEAQSDLNRIKIFLNTTADKYEIAEENINAAFQRMCELTGCTASETNSNNVQVSDESHTKWYEEEWVKWVGGVVITGAAFAACASGVGPLVAVGTAALAGGAINGVFEAIKAGIDGKDKSEAFINGYIGGSIFSGIGSMVGGPAWVGGAICSGGSTFLTNVLEGGKPLLDNLLESGISAFIGGYTANLFDDFSVFTKDKIFEAPAWVSNAVNKVGDSVKGAITKAPAWVSNAVNKVGDSIKGAITKVPSWVPNAANKVGDSIKGVITNLSNINSNIYIEDEVLIPIICGPLTGFLEETFFTNPLTNIIMGHVGDSISKGANSTSVFNLVPNL